MILQIVHAEQSKSLAFGCDSVSIYPREGAWVQFASTYSFPGNEVSAILAGRRKCTLEVEFDPVSLSIIRIRREIHGE